MDKRWTPSILDPTAMVFECLHYAGKIKPQRQSNGMYPVGVTLRSSDGINKQLVVNKTNANMRLPPSKAQAIRDLVSVDGYHANLPTFRVSPNLKTDMIAEAWKMICPMSNVSIKDADGDSYNVTVCVSTVDHENGQLEWGRKSKNQKDIKVPLCDYSEDCESLTLRGNQGPLGWYMTPLQQEAFDESGELADGPCFCLLCIRRDVHAFQLAYSSVMSSQMHAGRGVFVIPPFKNLVNVPGGYHESVMATKEDFFMPLPVFICGASGTLQTRYDPTREIWFIDQGSMVFQGGMRRTDTTTEKQARGGSDFQ